MSIYFTADTHFSHKNILKYENRPFNTVEEMNQGMIQNWNSKVKNTDQIYILGDFIFGNGIEANKMLRELNGQKFFIKGNHDSFLKDKEFNKNLFGWIKDYYVLNTEKGKFVLFHYPIYVWDCKHHGAIHLYGHVHSDPNNWHPMLDSLGKTYNVGVDVNNYEPVSLEEVLQRVQ